MRPSTTPPNLRLATLPSRFSRREDLLAGYLWGVDSLFSNMTRLGVLTAISLSAGVLGYVFLHDRLGVLTLIAACALVLTSPVAIAKTATACGINALGTFSRYDRPLIYRVIDAFVYMVTASLTASAIGLIAGFAGEVAGTGRWTLFLGPVFLLLGLREFGLFNRLRVPTMRWQVPARWVSDQRTAPLVWGFFLGSGLATWMPHASFYGLLLLAAFLPLPFGPILMASYGAIRAVPALLAALTRRCSGEVAFTGSLQIRLLGHAVAGAASLVLAGVLLALLVEVVVRAPAAVVLAVSAFVADSPISASAGAFIAVILAVAGIGKVGDRARFIGVLHDTYELPVGLSRFGGTAVPVLELVNSVLLIDPHTRLTGLVLASGLLSVMLVIAGSVVLAGGTGDCGCLGTFSSGSLGRATLSRLGTLLGIAIIGIIPAIHTSISTPAISANALATTTVVVSGSAFVLLVVGLATKRALQVLGTFER
ncbi:MAG: hypothetical protein KGN00_10740 [Chloroflexota bacterium]|nr:hypothetical protein [Chloroflexota bacterium]